MNRGNEAADHDPGGRRGVGILAASEASLQEIACLLARKEVAVSRAAVVAGDWPGALRELQQEPASQVIVLAGEDGAPAALEPILAQVGQSEKPTVVCLLGGDPRLAWRAGAIPARRLDEAARRAAAWIRGWDQALISSLFQEEDDVLSTRARALLPALGQGRGRSAHIMAPASLCDEARLMIAEVAGAKVPVTSSDLPAGIVPSLQEAVADAGTAVVVLAVGEGVGLTPRRRGELAQEVKAARAGGLLVCVHLYGPQCQTLAAAEVVLDRAGAVVAASNASAARLAGLVLRQMPDAR